MILQEDFVTGDSELKINAIAESTKTKFEKKWRNKLLLEHQRPFCGLTSKNFLYVLL